MIDGHPYFKNLIQLLPCDWVKQMAKINEAVGMKDRLTTSGEKKRLVRYFRRQYLYKCIGCVLSSVNYGNKVHKL